MWENAYLSIDNPKGRAFPVNDMVDALMYSPFCVGTKTLYYRPQQSCGKVMFLQVCVILFIGGVPDQVHPSPPRPGTAPQTRYSPRTRYIPKTRYTPQTRYSPPDQVHPWTRYTPWSRSTPWTRYPTDHVHPQDKGDTVYALAVCILLECNLV